MRIQGIRADRFVPMTVMAMAAMLAACSGNDSTAPGNTSAPMTQAEANSAADVVVSDLGSSAEGATSTTLSASFLAAGAGSGSGISAMVAEVSARPRAWWLSPCTPAPTRVVSGNTVTFTFTNCSITRLLPPETVVRNGVVALTRDSTTRQVVFTNYKRDITKLSIRTGAIATTSETRNGTRKVTRDDGTTMGLSIYGATAADPFETDWVAADSATGSHLRKWTSTFTADTAGAITADAPLPSGVFNVNGASQWSRTKAGVTKTWSLQTQTGATGVHYSAACDATGLAFDSGTLTTVATARDGTVTTIVITFTGCGTYTVTKN